MRFIAIAALFTSVSALACPNLAGKYAQCRSITGGASGSNDLEITQTVQNKITHYAVSSTDIETNERMTENYRADGKLISETISDPESGITLTTSSLVRCVNNSLSINVKASMGGQQVANITTIVSKANNQLTIKMTGTNFGETVSDTSICE